jgi:hypothetical protein
MEKLSREFLASEARRLSDEPLLKQALATMEATAVNDLLRADEANRVELITKIKIIREFQNNLRAMIVEGSRPRIQGAA